MKWFVTDAQLAAMRLELYEEISRDYQRAAAVVRERHDAEIQRLREDRALELARVADPSAPFLAHLLELVAILRRDVVHERQRSEISIDQCRITHQGIGPVAQQPREDRKPSEFPATEESALAALNIDGM